MLDVAGAKGLSPEEVEARAADGPNELPQARAQSFWRTAWEVVREPMFLLLVGAGVLYLLLGDKLEAAMLLGFVVVMIVISLVQARKTEAAVAALRTLSNPHALALRGGTWTRIPGREVVCGDLVSLSEGDRVPADATLIAARSLLIDESLLTGESVAVRKRPGREDEEAAPPGGDDLPTVWSGSLVSAGEGVARVSAIGVHTRLGQIGKSLADVEPSDTHLQREARRLVSVLAVFGAVVSIAVVVYAGLSRGDWLRALLSGVAVAMSMLPEEVPVVMTVFMALGAWRVAQKGVLARRVQAIEALGAATVLCVDKTGTLTENRMRVAAVDDGDASLRVGADALPESHHSLVEHAILAGRPDPVDPMERALSELATEQLPLAEHLHADWELIREYPLTPELLALAVAWRSKDTGGYTVAVKGAPEAIFDLCHLPPAETQRWKDRVEVLASDGLRVLGVAATSSETLPEAQHDFEFRILGLVGFADPIRASVPAAIASCRKAGVRVIVITGDYPATAASIARQAGLADDSVVLGTDLAELDDAGIRATLSKASVVARAIPEHKLRIVQALEAGGEVVAMTGDGVNDAPALRAAQIGIAMGERGTDVAREAAALVLVHDEFAAIPEAIAFGRRVFDNLQKALVYIIAVHMPIAAAAVVPLAMGWPPILGPAEIVFLELIIDPACAIAFEVEPAAADVLDRPPRARDASMLTMRALILAVLQGLSVGAAVLAVYWFALGHGYVDGSARALAFSTLISANAMLILVNRSWTSTIVGSIGVPNPASWIVSMGALVVLALVLFVPPLRVPFHLGPVEVMDAAAAVGVGVGSLVWFEVYKLIAGRSLHTASA